MFNQILIEPLANGLILFYKILGGNLGLAIIGFSIFLRLILDPLTRPYMESMKKMKDLAPHLEKIKIKYKNDKVKMAQAQSEFYKQRGVKPGSGCLPYIIQIVILIAFFNVFTKTLSAGGDITSNFNNLLYEPLKFTNGETINTKFLYLDVASPDTFDLGLPFPVPGPILILAALVQFLSSKMMTPVFEKEKKIVKKTEGSADDMQVAMQKSMVYTFPLFTIIFGIKFPSGLALYWFMFSLWQFLQQHKTNGWGGLTPWIKKLNLVKLAGENGKR